VTEYEKWEAVVGCAQQYDGVLWYGVKTTRIYCRPSCRSRTPRRENVVFFASCEEAMERGFRACKRCQPNRKPPECSPGQYRERRMEL
jgi:AraC family transcriptional regulator of adaptative response / methylphosphotriester-DNA alkyltransferase methyltransferase